MKKLFLLSFYLILAEQGFTCICQHPFTYCESMQAEAADLVVLGYKFTDKYHGMGIKVVQVLDGVENRDTLTVWGDNGMLCRTYCGTFGMGDTVLFALHHCDLSGNGGALWKSRKIIKFLFAVSIGSITKMGRFRGPLITEQPHLA